MTELLTTAKGWLRAIEEEAGVTSEQAVRE
jgi:hypothetical protein